MKKNKNNFKDLSWIKEFRFFGYLSPPFEITKTGRLLCYENQKIYSYDPEASSAKRVINFGKSISRAIPHKNTLVSLKVLGEKHTKTMEVGERAISDEVTENNAKRSKRSLAGTYVGAKGFRKRAGNA